MRDLKKILVPALTLVMAITSISSANAGTTVKGVETYLFHSEISNGTNSATDSSVFRFMGVEASFNYDISSVEVGTEMQFTLELTSQAPLTVGRGCCVFGGVDGIQEQQQVSTGGGIWTHIKAEGEKVANLRIYNRYDEFLDGKYKGLLGKVTAVTQVKIGDADPLTVSSANSSDYKVTYEFATYARTFTVPKQVKKLWLETMWSPSSQVSAGTVINYIEPKIKIKNSRTKKATTFKIINHGFSLSLAAYNDEEGFYDEGKGTQLTVTRANSKVSIGQGIYLPITTPVGSVITVDRFKVTRG